MIVRKRPSGLELAFILRGSILQRIWPQLAITVLIASAITVAGGTVFGLKIALTPPPFTMLGLALAIFLGFRNNACYDRYWEARKLWGELVIVSRSLTRQMTTLVSDEGGGKTRRVHRLIAFAHALRHHLRDTDPREDLKAFLAEEEWEGLRAGENIPDALLRSLAGDLRGCLAEKRTNALFLCRMDESLDSLAGVLGGCERIKLTPIPFAYTLLLHRTAYLYCFLLPFGLVDTIGFMTPLVVGIVSYTFFGLDAVGDEIEDPFGLMANDLPLGTLCRAIEINLRTALGERDLPEPLTPIDDCLS